MSKPRRITSKEQRCLSDCIRKFWGQDSPEDSAEKRDTDYEQCLTDCSICN